MKRSPASAPPNWAKRVHALLAEEHGDGDQRVDGGNVTGLDADREKEQEFHVAIEHADGDQQSENAAEAAVKGHRILCNSHGSSDDGK